MSQHADNCIFCSIVEGKIPCAKVYEDEHVLAFLDISQATKGHTLVIPKAHKQDVYALTEDMAGHLFAAVPKLANAIRDSYNPSGINVLNNNGEQAGQTVFHFHIHLIPRYEADGIKIGWKSNQSEYTPSDLQEIAGVIARNVQ